MWSSVLLTYENEVKRGSLFIQWHPFEIGCECPPVSKHFCQWTNLIFSRSVDFNHKKQFQRQQKQQQQHYGGTSRLCTCGICKDSIMLSISIQDLSVAQYIPEASSRAVSQPSDELRGRRMRRLTRWCSYSRSRATTTTFTASSSCIATARTCSSLMRTSSSPNSSPSSSMSTASGCCGLQLI